MKIILALTLLALAAAAASAARSADTATIRNSGSTNSNGYAIAVRPDGTARAGAKAFRLPNAIAVKFFADLTAAKREPARVQRCRKSASFGSRTTVVWGGWTSPDLECAAANGSARELASDVRTIVAVTSDTGRRVHLPLREPRRLEATPHADGGV